MRVTSDNLKAGEGYKVLLDGADVSDLCFMADDETGEVGMFLLDSLGADDVQTEIRTGNVVIYPMHKSVFSGE